MKQNSNEMTKTTTNGEQHRQKRDEEMQRDGRDRSDTLFIINKKRNRTAEIYYFLYSDGGETTILKSREIDWNKWNRQNRQKQQKRQKEQDREKQIEYKEKNRTDRIGRNKQNRL